MIILLVLSICKHISVVCRLLEVIFSVLNVLAGNDNGNTIPIVVSTNFDVKIVVVMTSILLVI